MTATFPLPLASLSDLVKIATLTWSLERFVETSGLGTGETLEAELSPPLWRADCESVPMPNAAANQLMARFYLLNGGQQSFYLSNPIAKYPQSDPTGSILGASAVKVKSVSSDKSSLAFKSLPNGYVLTIGDMVAVDYGSPARRALFIICASGNANGSGDTAELEVRPYVRAGIAADASVYFAKPAAKVRLLPDTLKMSQVTPRHSTISFSARQTLAAG